MKPKLEKQFGVAFMVFNQMLYRERNYMQLKAIFFDVYIVVSLKSILVYICLRHDIWY